MKIAAYNFFKRSQGYFRSCVIIVTALFFYITYVILTKSRGSLESSWLLVILYIDIVLISTSCLMILEQIKRVLRFRNLKQRGNKFHKQIIFLFSCGTIAPTSCVFVFAVLFFNVGIDNLFKAPIEDAINNANHVASIYVNDMKITMENFVSGVGERVEKCVNCFVIDTEKIEEILEEETSRLKIEAVVLMSADGRNFTVLAKSPFSLPSYLENLPSDILHLGVRNIFSWETESLVMAAQMVSAELGVYLVASTGIDPIIMDYKHKIKTAVTEYTNLATQRAGLKFTFITFFSVIAALLLLLSVFVGVIFANWILKPVNKLITATKSVGSGSYNSQIVSKKFNNEWDTLIITFNNMLSKLEQQKQQLVISNKQNAWRDIARKIAHEIKNPLTPIQLSAERLKNKYRNEITSSPEIFDACVDTIARQVSCIGNLVKEFSDFARMPAPKVKDADIVKILKEVVFIQSNAHKDISFQQNYSVHEFVFSFDQSQINQVMLNVLQNAINAVTENNTPRTDGIVGNIGVDLCTKNNMVCITIEDDGPGFSEVALERAMEPYYTTREAGSGLGLAIVYKIVKDHGGSVFLSRAEVLTGARISIEMPCYKKDPDQLSTNLYGA